MGPVTTIDRRKPAHWNKLKSATDNCPLLQFKTTCTESDTRFRTAPVGVQTGNASTRMLSGRTELEYHAASVPLCNSMENKPNFGPDSLGPPNKTQKSGEKLRPYSLESRDALNNDFGTTLL